MANKKRTVARRSNNWTHKKGKNKKAKLAREEQKFEDHIHILGSEQMWDMMEAAEEYDRWVAEQAEKKEDEEAPGTSRNSPSDEQNAAPQESEKKTEEVAVEDAKKQH